MSTFSCIIWLPVVKFPLILFLDFKIFWAGLPFFIILGLNNKLFFFRDSLIVIIGSSFIGKWIIAAKTDKAIAKYHA